MPQALPSSIIAEIAFVGRGGGFVKTLGGFKKGHHTLPDAANATTNSFLAKICEAELAAEAEALFQAVRTGLHYKRKDVALSVASPGAILTAKDFSVEIFYALEDDDPSRYSTTTTLRGLKDAELSRTSDFADIFSGRFTEILFSLKKGVSVEAVVDAIEVVGADGRLTVTYPSDCRDCVISVVGVDAQVRCTGASLEIVFSRGGGPAELIDAFSEIRGAFAISKVLAGLIG